MEKILSALTELKTWFSAEVLKVREAEQTAIKATTDLATASASIFDKDAKILSLETAAKSHAEAIAAKDTKITELEGELVAAKAQATEAIAGQSLPADQLPPGSTDTTSMNIDQKIKAIREKLAKSEDPKEKFILSQEIRSLLEKAKN
jgi:hypothetical protein